MTGAEYANACRFSILRRVCLPPAKELQRGGIIGMADVVDCVDDSVSPWFEGPFGLVLRNSVPTTFTPLKGRLGLFNVIWDGEGS
ncbi:MAG: hypothetical protein LBL59_07310 [Xanthomonadaceae bacterium]|jgi:hypothetical protein|nr:hypothetical protein [Xanthomonadaceae bacterium]